MEVGENCLIITICPSWHCDLVHLVSHHCVLNVVCAVFDEPLSELWFWFMWNDEKKSPCKFIIINWSLSLEWEKRNKNVWDARRWSRATMKKYSLVKHSDSIKLIILIINTCHRPLIANNSRPNCCELEDYYRSKSRRVLDSWRTNRSK